MTRQQELLLQLKQHNEYQALKSYLEGYLGKLQVELETAGDDEFKHIQGGCIVLRRVLDMFETELVMIDKLTNGTKSAPERVVG